MRPATASEAAQNLVTISEQPPEAAAAAIAEMAKDRTDPSWFREFDRALLELLEDRPVGDPILESLPLEKLQDLAARCISRLEESADGASQDAWALLDVARRSPVLQRISAAGTVDQWSDLILELVEKSQFTFPRLFAQRAAAYGSRVLIRLPGNTGSRSVTWYQAAGRIDLIARGLLAVTSGRPEGRIAILSENRLEMALADLACLATGIVNVMIPATATETDVAYILRHAGVTTVLVSTTEQLNKVIAAREQVPELSTIIAFDRDAAATRGVVSFDEVLARAGETSADVLPTHRESVTVDDLATIMYTSGTTGTPKGICFSQRNIVFKRFARALALPEIGEEDRFLCYLPLFHTFGRFLELTGCVFWGATYCFAENPAIDTLVRQMRDIRPTVFISIPMKWIQLYELVRNEVDVESASDGQLDDVTRRLTGGALRWGLSAAGYLDPEVFRFFQGRGIELMSGFGMTEATGGITMTPPGQYRDDSLGLPLPGVEIDLAADGELLARGPYVMMGYLDPPEGESSFDADGWLHTGDLMERDSAGHIRIVDRKKEIYKNVQGQTVAPQKIENLFRDVESLHRIFLVGDHRPYNTALIYPNMEFRELDFSTLPAEDCKDHFRSLVVSANTFLSPFERIVDFAIIDRDFETDRGELTPKGTYRRKTIERNFSDVISPLYRRTTLDVGGARITVPNWLFQAVGLTSGELRADGDRLLLPSVNSSLTIRNLGDEGIQVGSACYAVDKEPLDLGTMLSSPSLWLGNGELLAFTPLEPAQRNRRRHRDLPAVWHRRVDPPTVASADMDRAAALLMAPQLDLMDLHTVAMLLDGSDREAGILAVRVLEHVLELDDAELGRAALHILRRSVLNPEPDVLRRAFQVLAVYEEPARYDTTLNAFFDHSAQVLDRETVEVLAEHDLTSDQLGSFLAQAEARSLGDGQTPPDPVGARSLLQFLAHYGATHPSRYRLLRGFITRASMAASSLELREAAADSRWQLEVGFRNWLGPPSRIAVDPETGLEYRWDDVVAFSDEIDEATRATLLTAIARTTLLREAIFLFSGGAVVRLDDILPQGVWVRLLGSDHGKSVYRVAVKTRDGGQYDMAVNLNKDLPAETMDEEINWLIVCGEERSRAPLVELFGGQWPDYGLWTEEFIPGETLDRALDRLERRSRDDGWYESIWPFAAWSALGAYADFWDRTGRRLVIDDPTPTNVIVPMHDYHAGSRLVSISARRPFISMVDMLQSFQSQFIKSIEAKHPRLEGLAGWDVIFSSLLEVVGETEGLALLREALDDPDGAMNAEMAAALEPFLEAVSRRGFLPRRLFFGAKRFRRWDRLNPDATPTARAATLQEIFDTYRLAELQPVYPEVRPRFFRETVFREAPEALSEGLDDIVAQLRAAELVPDELSSAVADLRARRSLSPDEDYFLARLSYPYLRPEDETEYVETDAGGVHQSEMVVTLEDHDGRPYQVRHAISPKEVARLHQLFLAARLPVQFRADHRFLVAVNLRGHLIGGLFYETQPETQSAHMDKVVVAEAFQGHGVAGALIEELCNRLRTAGFKSLTTGFFRPQFFYRYGFTVERRYAGLVRPLTERESS